LDVGVAHERLDPYGYPVLEPDEQHEAGQSPTCLAPATPRQTATQKNHFPNSSPMRMMVCWVMCFAPHMIASGTVTNDQRKWLKMPGIMNISAPWLISERGEFLDHDCEIGHDAQDNEREHNLEKTPPFNTVRYIELGQLALPVRICLCDGSLEGEVPQIDLFGPRTPSRY